ncbi:MAG: A/G-specific adenine glycosylase [Runella slithyformis]|nr:MAG: A/G-specific adenine glycosylase [Runella slithyformis]TAF80672.1 MAG: A/G-specific adenine glycosylase [Runella slithyformis]TAH07751.1 MAG: A/G-specific adenine glycosylase [Runella slithyformis]
MEIKSFAQNIVGWYHRHCRDLPWRHTRNPYFIWLSEVILQQTRVAQGTPYYLKFVEQYPTIFDLAAAPEQEVMRLWQGLGYYSRARNLHQTAQYIVQNLNGQFPDSYQKLLQLKGIGPYTAAAVASFAYNEAVAVVDGNVYRVLARVFGIDTDVASTAGKKEFAHLAAQLIDQAQPATYNQAIMEFGAIQCQPVSPDCLLCPLQGQCLANATGRVGELPFKTKKTKVRERFFNYLVFRQGNSIALQLRTNRDIWQQLYDFYLVETDDLVSDLDQLPLENTTGTITGPSRVYTHILTHQRIQAQFWQVHLADSQAGVLPVGLQLYTPDEIEALPKPVLISAYLKEYF